MSLKSGLGGGGKRVVAGAKKAGMKLGLGAKPIRSDEDDESERDA